MESVIQGGELEVPETDKGKKKNIAKDMKERFAKLCRHSDPSSGAATASAKDSKPARPTPDAVRNWNRSLDNLLHDKTGFELFREFLRTEFSEENLEFWVACEEYKTVGPDKLDAQAQKIFTDFVAIQAPREINLDSKTRELTATKMSNPDEKTFEEAQRRIQALMEKDSYPRFLRSEYYKSWLTQLKIRINAT